MRIARPVLFVLVLALGATACGNQPETCDEVADETIEHSQRLIDEIEAEVGEMDVEELIGMLLADEELPSVENLRKRAAELSVRAEELGCTEEQFQEAVAARAHLLEANTPIGEFIIEAIERGGL